MQPNPQSICSHLRMTNTPDPQRDSLVSDYFKGLQDMTLYG
jgi:hypothetical protein